MNTEDRPQRVHIIGGGGAGKTTLGRQLAALLGLDLAELDSGTDLGQLARRPRWVAEGIFVYGVGDLMHRADLIIWLDLPRRVTRRRIVTRHLKLTVTGANPHRGWRLLWRFLMSQRLYYTEPGREPAGPTDWDAITRAATARLLASHRSRVLVLRSPREVRRWRRAVTRRWSQASVPSGSDGASSRPNSSA